MKVRNVRSHYPFLLGVLVAMGLAFFAVTWRLHVAPDVFTDEILYTRAGIRIANEGALVWDDSDALVVHPPLYFLAEAVYLKLTSDPSQVMHQPGDIFAWVYHARWLNAFFAALTAGLLYAIGHRLRGPFLGALFVGLFILDPFGLRINRRAMLETLTGLLTLAGMAVILPRPERLPPARAILAGLLFGGAMLTKELAFTSLLVVLVFWFWKRIREPADAALYRWLLAIPLIATLTYLLFPLWIYSAGEWQRFVQVKLLSLNRLLGLVQITGWNRPGVSLWEFLSTRLVDYGSSYVLLALGALATLWLLFWHRDEGTGRLLAIWGLILYPFYAFVALFGSGNDQFFYFLLVPAMLILGYAVTSLPDGWHRLDTVVLLVILIPFNASLWWGDYGMGTDNAYHQLARYVEENVPAGEAINATGDALKFEYFFPERPVTGAKVPEEAPATGTRYFALSPKDVWAGYRTTPELAAWIEERGERLFAATGSSYGDLFLYRVDHEGPAPETLSSPRPFPPADTAFVGTLVAMMMAWVAGIVALALWMSSRQEPVRVPGIEAEGEPTQAYRT